MWFFHHIKQKNRLMSWIKHMLSKNSRFRLHDISPVIARPVVRNKNGNWARQLIVLSCVVYHNGRHPTPHLGRLTTTKKTSVSEFFGPVVCLHFVPWRQQAMFGWETTRSLSCLSAKSQQEIMNLKTPNLTQWPSKQVYQRKPETCQNPCRTFRIFVVWVEP